MKQGLREGAVNHVRKEANVDGVALEVSVHMDRI